MANHKITPADSDDEYEFIEALPTRTKTSRAQNAFPDVSIYLQPTDMPGQMLISVTPPTAPSGEPKHTPCDIVLVIDVSASMQTAAELPDQHDQQQKEQSGLSILDLVKHASRTILENLDQNDRLAIVTFSSNAHVVQELLPMTEDERRKTATRIEELEVKDCTNLWSGIRGGLKILEDTKAIGNVQGMFVLTDGAPNHMCPTQGYVKKLKPTFQRMRDSSGTTPTISTFGFGYSMKSALLRSIAEVGRGYYAFIPDAGMIGTVFVHAVANLFSTFATNAELVIPWTDPDNPVTVPSYLGMQNVAQGSDTLATIISLGNLLYGHSRNIVVEGARPAGKTAPSATIRYRIPGDADTGIISSSQCKVITRHSASIMAYHLSRHELCDFLSSCFAKNLLKTSPILPVLEQLVQTLNERLAKLREDPDRDVSDLEALVADLAASDSDSIHGAGQILLALRTDTPPSDNAAPTRLVRQSKSYYARWGMHYLPAILHSHMYQITTTFKDPGPQRYCLNSPLFMKCRDELDEAFDRLPAPKPSPQLQFLCWGNQDLVAKAAGTKMKMSRFNRVSNPCFSGECLMRMGYEGEQNASEMTKVQDIRPGQKVWTLAGARIVKEIVRTKAKEQDMCVFAGLRITPWHPIHWEGKWLFPDELCVSRTVQRTTLRNNVIYSFMLEKDDNAEAYTVEVGGIRATTLGHGLTRFDDDDVRGHPFFGDYEVLRKSLSRLEVDECGRRICGGIVRCKHEDGRVVVDFI